MKSKSDVRPLFLSFYTMVAAQFGQNIKSIRTNNAKEFDMSDFLNSHGIIHQHSCVYTPQQNFVVERKHFLLWRESTSIYFPLQGLYKFSLKFLFNSGVIVS